jgi:hypothetical protein
MHARHQNGTSVVHAARELEWKKMFTKVKNFARARNAGMEGARATCEYGNGSSDSDL